MSTVITPFQGIDPFSTATFNNRISQINTGFSYISNPNLLDNWYFVNPVNQRGQTSYTGVGYGIDRWKVLTDAATLTISNDGITLHRNGGDKWLFAEQMEPSIVTNFMGKHFTVSVLTTQGLVVLDVPSAFTSETSVTDPTGVCVWLNTTGIALFGTINDSITPIAVKLELGSQQTLAHKDADGNWVLNEVPDYGEQLRRCQRYFLKIGDVSHYCSLGNGLARNAQNVSITIPTPVTMRTVPGLIAIPAGFTMRHSDALLSGGANFSVDASSQNSIMLKIQSQVALTPGDMWEAFLQPNGSIMFSADL